MKKAHIIAFLLISFLMASFITSCTSSDEEVVVVRDTVIIPSPPPLKNQVSVETINKRFVIQLASFNKIENANKFVNQAKEKLGAMPEIRRFGNFHVITVGIYNNANSAQDYLTTVKSKGFPDAFIKAID